MQNEYYVYILECNDCSFYVGVTNNFQLRIQQHQDGQHPQAFTYKRRPLRLVYLSVFQDINEAIAWEKRLKRWSRKKKEALIAGELERLITLSKRQSPHSVIFRISSAIRRKCKRVHASRRPSGVILRKPKRSGGCLEG